MKITQIMWSFERVNPCNQFKLLKAFGYWPLPVVWRLSQCLLCPEICCHLGQINRCTFRHQQHSGAAAVWPSHTIFSSLSISIFTLPNFIILYRTCKYHNTSATHILTKTSLIWSNRTVSGYWASDTSQRQFIACQTWPCLRSFYACIRW